MIDRAHPGIGQALDRLRLPLEQHAFDAHQIAGQENHHDLPAAILGRAGSRNPAGLQQVYRAALLAGTDKHLTLAAGAGPALIACLDDRLATDQQITQLRTVQRDNEYLTYRSRIFWRKRR